jgi:hypothetical protein
MPCWSGAGAARDGFVVAKAFYFGPLRRLAATAVRERRPTKSEGQVVAVALAGGASAEGKKHDVRDTLGLRDVNVSSEVLRWQMRKVLTVSTFPPTTAALSEGERKDFLGIFTWIGLRQP